MPQCRKPYDPVTRFWSKVEDKGFCWEWTKSLDSNGYGRTDSPRLRQQLRVGYSAHRIAYSLIIGPIPSGMTLDHLCRNIICVNPMHLEPVSNSVNVLRGNGWGAVNKRKTHCKRKHELTPENVYQYTQEKDGYTRRCCKLCIKARQQKP